MFLDDPHIYKELVCFVSDADYLSGMADTGSQNCLASLKVIKKLGLSAQELIPVDIKMHAANNNIHILGATILRFSGNKNREEQS